MKITAKRSGISQSLDLFIIIAAVLAVGGIVTAAVYGLANSATTNSSIQIVSATVHPGTVGATISIKNSGGSSLASGASVTVSITGATITGLSASPVSLTGTYPSMTLNSVLASGAQDILTVTDSAGPSAGQTVSVTVSVGSATQTVQVIVSQT